MFDISIYHENLQSFLNNLEGSYIEKLLFEEDLNPTFHKNTMPFKFSYCLSVSFITNKGNFLLHTSATSSGSETFWTQNLDSKKDYTSEKTINSKVKSVSNIQLLDDHPYKFSIFLETGVLIFYAAEIFDGQNDNYSIKLNDEMVFVFDNELDALNFEKSLNYA